MIRRAGICVAAVAACLLGAIGAVPVRAQATPGGLPFDLKIPAPLLLGFAGQAGGVVDPTHSNAAALLQRNDVRNELVLTLKQKNAIAEMQDTSRQEFMTTIRKSATDLFQDIGTTPPDQIQQKIQDGLDGLVTVVQTFEGDVDKRTEAILKPEQIVRLHELDLQWRGPLALTDAKVSTLVILRPDQKQKVDALVVDLASGQQKALMAVMSPLMGQFGPGGGGGAAPNREDIRKKVAQATHTPELDKAHKVATDKAVALLDPAQTAAWIRAQGAPFTFSKRPQNADNNP